MAPSTVFAQARAAAKVGGKRKRATTDEGQKIPVLKEVTVFSDEEASESSDNVDDVEDEVEESGLLMNSYSKGKKAGTEMDGEVAKKLVFKQKTLILSSRGITHRMRHMMKDLAMLLPHSKSDAKLDTKHHLSLLNELADLSNCSSLLFFEARRHSDLYLWASMTPNGPSARFHLLNAHTMDELKMTGNCLKGSRPVVVFDHTFENAPHWRLMKELLMQIFAVPKTARRAKPFIDHVTSFAVTDGKIWFRNYQIVHDGTSINQATGITNSSELEKTNKPFMHKLSKQAEENMSLNEIGPRFVLTPVKIFEGSFGGAVIWENPEFVAPAAKLAHAKMAKAADYRGRKEAETDRKGRKEYLHAQEQADFQKSGRAALTKRRVFA